MYCMLLWHYLFTTKIFIRSINRLLSDTKNTFRSYIVEFNVDLTANLCGAVAEHADQQIDWASAILTGVSCPTNRIAKVN